MDVLMKKLYISTKNVGVLLCYFILYIVGSAMYIYLTQYEKQLKPRNIPLTNTDVQHTQTGAGHRCPALRTGAVG